jgi:hypothetical protein
VKQAASVIAAAKESIDCLLTGFGFTNPFFVIVCVLVISYKFIINKKKFK